MNGTSPDRLPDTDEIKSRHVEGLELAWLHPPNIVSFFHGIPARAHETKQRWDDPEASRERSADDDARFPKILEDLADQLSNTVERVRAAGYPMNPSVEGVREPQDLEGDSVMKRIYDAATEILRRLAGVGSEEWGDGSPDSLLGTLRLAVGETSWQLRRLNDEETAMSDVPESEIPASGEVTPDSADDVIEARDGIDALGDSVSRPSATPSHERPRQES